MGKTGQIEAMAKMTQPEPASARQRPCKAMVRLAALLAVIYTAAMFVWLDAVVFLVARTVVLAVVLAMWLKCRQQQR